MKNILFVLLAAVSCSAALAAPGDTTWVQAHTAVQMPNYGNYDAPVQFPDGSKSYRKIIMEYTNGKYVCPGSPQYCSDWDYTVLNYLMTPGGDTFEIARYITPYGKGARQPAGYTHRYYFDVTDFYPIMKDAATIRILYSGYSGGYTASVRFAFIEGTPERNVLKIEKLYNGSWTYGNAANPIENHLPDVARTAPAGTAGAELKTLITGHGSDNAGCSEFCRKYYSVLLNGNNIFQQDIWRDNCGSNELYPQSGTWIYDRANWCPGDQVIPITNRLTGVGDGTAFSVNVDLESHVSTGGSASFTISSYIAYYGPYNNPVNASLASIVAPSNYEGYFRENPIVGKPKIKVTNTGSAPLTSMQFQYGVVGAADLSQYSWTGNILSGQTAMIELPEPWWLRVATGVNTFTARILTANGAPDADATDNEMRSTFNAAPVWPVELRIRMITNNAVISSGFSENSWRIRDLAGNIVASRTDAAPSTIYQDTLTLGPGPYKLEVTDSGCDGLSWWANQAAGNGSITAYRMNGSLIPLALGGNFGADFGCGFTQYFRTDWPTAVEDVAVSGMPRLSAVPSPANNSLTFNVDGPANAGSVRLYDITGREAAAWTMSSRTATMDVSGIAAGVYTARFEPAQKQGGTAFQKVVIQH